MYPVWMYVSYLLISTLLTIWVARTLFKHGRVFLVEAFANNEPLADSVNHLLVVGFYLINIGYVTLALSYGDKPNNIEALIEALSWKIGLVLVVLGFMHFFNLAIFSKMRKHTLQKNLVLAPAMNAPVPDSLKAFAAAKAATHEK